MTPIVMTWTAVCWWRCVVRRRGRVMHSMVPRGGPSMATMAMHHASSGKRRSK